MIIDKNFEVYTQDKNKLGAVYGFVRKFVSSVSLSKKICVSVNWVTLWVHPPPCENMCVRSLGYIVGASPPLCVHSIGNTVGASPPRVCPFIGRQSSLDPCMLPTPLCGIF